MHPAADTGSGCTWQTDDIGDAAAIPCRGRNLSLNLPAPTPPWRRHTRLLSPPPSPTPSLQRKTPPLSSFTLPLLPPTRRRQQLNTPGGTRKGISTKSTFVQHPIGSLHAGGVGPCVGQVATPTSGVRPPAPSGCVDEGRVLRHGSFKKTSAKVQPLRAAGQAEGRGADVQALLSG